MKNMLLVMVMLVVCSVVSAHEYEQTYRKGELLVLFKPGINVKQFVDYNYGGGYSAIRQLSPAMNVWLVAYDTSAITAEEAKDVAAKSKYVQVVQFNHNNIQLKNNTPNDSLYAYQWDMDIISATQAWAIDTGGIAANGAPIVLASIDGGFDISHPDLNVWHNENEIPGNGIDDDGNGYIDDYRGWNASLLSDSITLGTGHGTNTMGISSAHGNNTIGIAGVNWNVQAMAVVTDIYNESTVISAYAYVFEQRKLYNETNGTKGAFIVATNSSFGPSGYGYQYPLWNAMYDSMGSVGILSAGATSNDPTCNTDSCPDIPSQCASYYTVITTGTNAADVRHGGYGPVNVDIAAPGNGSYTILSGGGYGGFGGTSAASPHVAGAIALMWSAACPKMLNDYKQYPDSLARVMKRYLLAGVDTLPALVGMIASGGRLNLFKALSNVQGYDCILPVSGISALSADNTRLYPNPTTGIVTIGSDKRFISAKVFDGLGRQMNVELINNTFSLAYFAAGMYTVELIDTNHNEVMKKIVRQ